MFIPVLRCHWIRKGHLGGLLFVPVSSVFFGTISRAISWKIVIEMLVEKERSPWRISIFSFHYGDVKEEGNATLNGLGYEEAH